MNVQITADDDLQDYDDYDGDFAELDRDRRPSLNLGGGGTDLFRGVLVVLIALAVGALVLARGMDSPDTADSVEEDDAALSAEDPAATSPADDAAGAEDGSTADTDASGAMTDPATPATNATPTSMTGDTTADGAMAPADSATDGSTSTSAMTDAMAVRPPAEVEVLVLNSTDRKGIAAQGTELLELSNYATIPAGNATRSMGSVILYMEGYRAEAVAVAEVFSDGLEGLVQPYDPADPPALASDIGDAKVIVVLGVDDAIPLG